MTLRKGPMALTSRTSSSRNSTWWPSPSSRRPVASTAARGASATGTPRAEVGASPGRLRFALCVTSALGVPVADAPRAAVEATGRLLEGLGHHVEFLEEDVLDVNAIGPFLNVINTGYGDYPGVDWSNVEPHNVLGHAAAQ